MLTDSLGKDDDVKLSGDEEVGNESEAYPCVLGSEKTLSFPIDIFCHVAGERPSVDILQTTKLIVSCIIFVVVVIYSECFSFVITRTGKISGIVEITRFVEKDKRTRCQKIMSQMLPLWRNKVTLFLRPRPP